MASERSSLGLLYPCFSLVQPMKEVRSTCRLVCFPTNHLCEQNWLVSQAAQTQTYSVLLSSPSWLQGKCDFPGEAFLLQLHAPLTI